MKRRWLGLMASVVVSAMTRGAHAQMGDADGLPMAMGAGRMVRGTVVAAATAATKDRLTVKTEAGEVYQVIVTPNTQVRKGRELVKLADVHAGDGVGAMGEVEPAAKIVHALFLGVLDAEQVRKAREDLGKTWIAGKVTGIDELKLTVLRADKVSQTIEVDEDTSFKRGGREMQMMFGDGPVGEGGGPRRARAGDGESITLGDVKVGDSVAGPGALKHGVFVPKQLAVADASAKRPRGAVSGHGAGAALEPK